MTMGCPLASTCMLSRVRLQTASQTRPRKSIIHGAEVAGASLDVSFLIDFLPSYLFPNAERTISQWLISGISLGGHATWIILKNGETPTLPRRTLLIQPTEPRIQLGIPIIGQCQTSTTCICILTTRQDARITSH